MEPPSMPHSADMERPYTTNQSATCRKLKPGQHGPVSLQEKKREQNRIAQQKYRGRKDSAITNLTAFKHDAIKHIKILEKIIAKLDFENYHLRNHICQMTALASSTPLPVSSFDGDPVPNFTAGATSSHLPTLRCHANQVMSAETAEVDLATHVLLNYPPAHTVNDRSPMLYDTTISGIDDNDILQDWLLDPEEHSGGRALGKS